LEIKVVNETFNMPHVDRGDIVIIAYYIVAIGLGFFCLKPKVAFYLSVLLAIAFSYLLFVLHIYIELEGMAQMLPFAFVVFFISRSRYKRRQRAQAANSTSHP
jgi:hypothetical protein